MDGATNYGTPITKHIPLSGDTGTASINKIKFPGKELTGA